MSYTFQSCVPIAGSGSTAKTASQSKQIPSITPDEAERLFRKLSLRTTPLSHAKARPAGTPTASNPYESAHGRIASQKPVRPIHSKAATPVSNVSLSTELLHSIMVSTKQPDDFKKAASKFLITQHGADPVAAMSLGKDNSARRWHHSAALAEIKPKSVVTFDKFEKTAALVAKKFDNPQLTVAAKKQIFDNAVDSGMCPMHTFEDGGNLVVKAQENDNKNRELTNHVVKACMKYIDMNINGNKPDSTTIANNIMQKTKAKFVPVAGAPHVFTRASAHDDDEECSDDDEDYSQSNSEDSNSSDDDLVDSGDETGSESDDY